LGDWQCRRADVIVTGAGRGATVVVDGRLLRHPASRVVAALLAAGVGLISLRAAEAAPGFSYLSGSAASAVLGLAGGWGLVVAGLETCRRGRRTWLGALLVTGGVAWFLSEWSDPTIGFDAGFTVGLGFGWLYLPLVGHALLSVAGGPGDPRIRRAFLAAGYGVAVLGLGLVPAMGFDPRASGCGFCPANLIDVTSAPSVSDAAARVGAALGVAWALAAATALTVTLYRASEEVRRFAAPILGPGIIFLMLASVALGRAAVADIPSTDPLDQLLRLGQATALLALAVGVGSDWIRTRRARGRVARIVAELAGSPAVGGLRDHLASVLRDPDLLIAYPVGGEQLVDAGGRLVSIEPRAGRSTTPIVRDGSIVAVVEHDAEVLRNPDEIEEVIAAARLGLEHERLQAEARAQLDALRAARRRIVEAGDTRRKQLERDLHDGAQQHLIAVAIGLRLIEPGSDVGTLLDTAARELNLALDDLRRVAHGIYPAVLGDEGFAAAVDALAEGSTTPVTIGAMVEDRFDPMVEAAAYHVVAETLRGGRGPVQISATRNEQGLAIKVTLDDLPGHIAEDLADRVGAVDGSIAVTRQGDQVDLQVEIPCGS
jgi:signal transduction histidine kinase